MEKDPLSDEEIEASVADAKVLIIDGRLFLAMPVTVKQLSRISGRTEEEVLDIVSEKMYSSIESEVEIPKGVN